MKSVSRDDEESPQMDDELREEEQPLLPPGRADKVELPAALGAATGTSSTSSWLKISVLVLMIVQNMGAVFLMRFSQTSQHTGLRYLPSVAVVFQELSKFVASLALVSYESSSVVGGLSKVRHSFFSNPMDLLKLLVPGLMYTVQNNLLFAALNNLSVGEYQVMYQSKTLTTAMFSVMLLGRRLDSAQWLALFGITLGVALMESNAGGGGEKEIAHHWLGFCAVINAALFSGFGGVYMEMLLKQPGLSLWVRNVQLAAVGAPMSLAAAFWADGAAIHQDGLFQGFDAMVWMVIAVNAFGGLCVAAVLRYADNIAKCFAMATAIVLTTVVSSLIGEFIFTIHAITGIFLVVASSLLYALGISDDVKRVVRARAWELGLLVVFASVLGIGRELALGGELKSPEVVWIGKWLPKGHIAGMESNAN